MGIGGERLFGKGVQLWPTRMHAVNWNVWIGR